MSPNPKSEHNNFPTDSEDVVISGISGRYPESADINEFWERLLAGEDLGTADARRWPIGIYDLPMRSGKIPDANKFDAEFFKYSDQEANWMDPQTRVFHETTYEAILDAGIDPDDMRGTNTNVYVGFCYSDTDSALKEDAEKVPLLLQNWSTRISHRFGFKGTAVTVDTACASSFTAFHQALVAIRSGLCDSAIVGGLAIHTKPWLAHCFYNLNMISHDGKSKCMDAAADGYLRSEAVVSILLQKKGDAKRVYAKVLNGRTNNDGFKTEGITFPSMEAQKRLMQETYDEIAMDPLRIDFVEAHMTGTTAGDPVESLAISSVLCKNRSKPLMVGCLKSNMGHTEGASGLCAITKTCLALQRKVLPPNLHYTKPNPMIESLKSGKLMPITSKQPFDGELIALNCFGFGGCNVHVAIQANQKKDTILNHHIMNGFLPRLIVLCGRTKNALEKKLKYLEDHPEDVTQDFCSLLNDISKRGPEKGLIFRSYVIMNDEKHRLKSKSQITREKKPLWLVFPGVGCQWTGISEKLLSFKPFASSLMESDRILKLNHDMSLVQDILFRNHAETAVESVVSIISYQMALYDLLISLGVTSDGIFGTSFGEITCGYADGCLSREDTLRIAFSIGTIIEKMRNKNIMTVEVSGINTEDIEELLIPGVEIIGRNSISCMTFSGNESCVKSFIEIIRTRRTYVNKINFHEVPLHSSQVLDAYNQIKSCIESMEIPIRQRSSNWLSTSIPQEIWYKNQGLDPAYFARNIAADVKLTQILDFIPKDSVILEMGPNDSVILPHVRRGVGPDATYMSMAHAVADPVTILSTIGEIYMNGHNPKIETLYPTVDYPVARETASISPLVKWEHSKDRLFPTFPDYFMCINEKRPFTLDMMNPKYKYLMGHCIDGRVLFPATGYLWLAWDTFLHIRGYSKEGDFTHVGVEFRDVKFSRATLVPKTGTIGFTIMILSTTGHFAITEGGTTCVSGFIKLLETDASTEELEERVVVNRQIKDNETLLLSSKDIYKELRVRGYDYGSTFQGLTEASTDGLTGKVKWSGNWVSFSDSMLQMAIFGTEKRELLLPTYIEYMKCDGTALMSHIESCESHVVDIRFDKMANIGCCRGMVIRGLKASPAPRRNTQKPTTERHEFTPFNQLINISEEKCQEFKAYDKSCLGVVAKIMGDSKDEMIESTDGIQKEKSVILNLLMEAQKDKTPSFEVLRESNLSSDILMSSWESEALIRSHVDLVAENTFSKDLQILEVNSSKNFLCNTITEIMNSNAINVKYSVHHGDPPKLDGLLYNCSFQQLKSTGLPSDISSKLVVFKDSSASFLFESLPENHLDLDTFLKSASESVTSGTFVLILARSTSWGFENVLCRHLNQESLKFRTGSELRDMAQKYGFLSIGLKEDSFGHMSLLLRKPDVSSSFDTIEVKVGDYRWIEDVKRALAPGSDDKKRVWLTATDVPHNGILGLVNCLRKEDGGHRIRSIFAPKCDPMDNNNLLTKEMMSRDLVVNVIMDDTIGSYRYSSIQELSSFEKTRHAYLDVQTKGDLSSLKFYAANRTCIPIELKTQPKVNQASKSLFTIAFSALNFKDVMVASGRIPPAAYPQDFCRDGNLGMEFSGVDQNKRRVMGITASNGIASSLISDDLFVWDVPDFMSLRDAATIPVAYLTVYYAMLIRGKLMNGETVLIHAGTGGVGQAAISVCLSMGCTVFTTVGSKLKREFIRRNFPQIPETHILNSRDTNFEYEILRETDGRGVDVILNSLAEEKMKASFRCLADFGRFLEIGKYDIIQNNPFNIADFADNKTFHVVCVAHLMHECQKTKSTSALEMAYRLKKYINDGMKTGEVRPLQSHLFDVTKTEDAFRFMANGKHMGKVLIKIKGEEENITLNGHPISVRAIRKTYFDPNKTYIVTGGLGGFGLELCYWIIEKGARNLIITSRSGLKSPYQKLSVSRLKSAGAFVKISENDLSTIEKTQQLMREARKMGPVGGIFHLAMVLSDAILENQTVEKFEDVAAAKVTSTVNLDRVTRNECPDLDHFVCFSSVTSGRGNAGQTNYGFANSVMERICEERKRDGLCGISIQWGAIGDVGVVAEKLGGNDVVIGGSVPQRIPSCLEVLDLFLVSDGSVYSSLVRADKKTSVGSGKDDLLKVICHVLGVKDPSALDPMTTLGDLGLDSLMAVEIRQGLERDYDLVLSAQEVRSLKIKDIQELGGQLKKSSAVTSEEDDTKYSFNFELPQDLFIHLNDAETGKPIFLFPPIEGDFSSLMPVIKNNVIRPVVGVNWTADCENLRTIQEVATFYIKKIQESYPDNDYDLMGYSYGSLVALEMAIQMQAVNVRSVEKLLLMDGSPFYLKKSMTLVDKFNHINAKNLTPLDILSEFASSVLTVTHTDLHELIKSLPEDSKVETIAALMKKELGVDVDSETLVAAGSRYIRKVRQINSYEMKKKFKGDIRLIRASLGYRSHVDYKFSEDYDLSRVTTGSVEVIKHDGDHRSFLSVNSEKIGTCIDDFYRFLAIA